MACIKELDIAARLGAPADQGRVSSGEPAVAQKAVDVNNNLRQGKTHADEAAEERVELRHPHRCRYALAHDIAEHEEEPPMGWVKVTIVAADRSKGRVVIAGFPPIYGEIRGWQEAPLQF